MPERNGASGPFSLPERMLALRYLRAKRAQGGVGSMAVISFLGIMAAVFVLIVTMSIMNGFRETLLSKIIGVGGHITLFTQDRSNEELDAAVRAAAALPGVERVTPLVQSETLISRAGQTTGAIAFGIDKEALARLTTVSQGIRRGSLQGFGKGDPGEGEIVLGDKLAARLQVGVGDTVTLVAPKGPVTVIGSTPRRQSYRVGAIFSIGYFLADSAYAYLPLEEAQWFFGRGEGVDVLEVRVRDPERSQAATEALRQSLPFIPINDWRDNNREYFTALVVERNAMRFILMIVVAIAALNIISGLVMLVKNKARDVAILRTMGATRGAILRVFLLAGGLLGASGALAGVGLAALFLANIGAIQAALEFVTGTQVFDASVYQLSRVPTSIQPLEVAGVTLFAIVMAFLAALLPALTASRLDPVEALRYE